MKKTMISNSKTRTMGPIMIGNDSPQQDRPIKKTTTKAPMKTGDYAN